MSKTSLSIQMLEILYSRRVVSIAELARLLETNPRNIPEYKKELEQAGYYIETVAGRYGGYSLDKSRTFPSIKLSEEERNGLFSAQAYLLARNDFMEKKPFSMAMAKIASSIERADAIENATVTNRFPLVMSEDELQSRYTLLSQGQKSKHKIKIEYDGISEPVSERIIHTYKLFMYNNAWFALAYDEKTDSVRYFKLNRILRYQLLSDVFRIPYAYNERDYVDEYGMRQNGQWYDVELKITGKRAKLIKERVYGRDQIIEDTENGVIFKCKMQNKEDIISFVLGYGTNAQVISPLWLKESILERISAIKALYDKE